MADTQKLGSSLLVGAIAFIAISGWAAVEYIPAALQEYAPRIIDTRHRPTQSVMIPVMETLPENEAIVIAGPQEPDSTVVQRPRSLPRQSPAKRTTVHPAAGTSRVAILVEERRLTQDERIAQEVMDRLASSRLSGKIGVESKNAVVRLTGWTPTAGQARHAERDARSVSQVKQVLNEIRPRVGGSV